MARGLPVPDDRLRVRALEALGAFGDEIARAVLASGAVALEHDAMEWDGSSGHVRAHRVVVTVEAELHARFHASHAANDALVAALSAAMAERPSEVVGHVDVVAGDPGVAPSMGPYRAGR
ncbi:MAG: hypothetical protein JST00_19975 [Deltaproteobacteria bacterium]|nr:hypothetical protein [Deltaproteobacteria bacterium]